ncbi:MAG: PadR family transcriptional regulator [Actinobacteria bacterium]|nr:PadR family transcriptional regulator [Actinomycetota bacterium]
MPTDALANPLVLPILGLLVERPRHAYAVFSELRSRYDYLTVRNATVYTLLNTLVNAGWIEAGPSSGPDRQEFALSEAGRRTLAGRVNRDLREADLADGTAFMTALAYLGILDPTTAADALEARAERIRIEEQRLDRLLSSAGVTELHMIEVHFYRDRLRHDRTWLNTTIHRIQSEALAWPNRRD